MYVRTCVHTCVHAQIIPIFTIQHLRLNHGMNNAAQVFASTEGQKTFSAGSKKTFAKSLKLNGSNFPFSSDHCNWRYFVHRGGKLPTQRAEIRWSRNSVAMKDYCHK